MLSSSARGGTGPESQYAGYAAVTHAIGGAAYIAGYADGPPGYALGDVDLMNATASAIAIVAALRYRDLTGEGQFIDYSQAEGVTSLIGEVLLEHQMTGRIPGRKGNSDEFMAPHNVYLAGASTAGWLSPSQPMTSSRLCDVIGMPELADDASLRYCRRANRTRRRSTRSSPAGSRQQTATTRPIACAPESPPLRRATRRTFSPRPAPARAWRLRRGRAPGGRLQRGHGPPGRRRTASHHASRAGLGEHNDYVL
jgi:crotonobetainyl-CoA:carnitine CoA-transferase CaiB-like acyl-CoA transferase